MMLFTLFGISALLLIYIKIVVKNSDFIITATAWLMVDDLYLWLDERFLIAFCHCLRGTSIVFLLGYKRIEIKTLRLIWIKFEKIYCSKLEYPEKNMFIAHFECARVPATLVIN